MIIAPIVCGQREGEERKTDREGKEGGSFKMARVVVVFMAAGR